MRNELRSAEETAGHPRVAATAPTWEIAGEAAVEDYLDRVFAPLVETVPYATLRAAAPPESRLVRARRWMDRGAAGPAGANPARR